MVAIGTNFFYTVTLPVTLWFLDKGKRGTDREDTVLFIDARHILPPDRPRPPRLPARADRVPRQHRPPLPRRGSRDRRRQRGAAQGALPRRHLCRRAGLCKVATAAEIEAQGWSLNPGRYTGTAAVDDDDDDFAEKARVALRGVHEAQRRSRRTSGNGRYGGDGDFGLVTGWRALKMADVMAEFYDGPHATPPPADVGPVYLGIKNITESGLLDLSDIRHIAEDDFRGGRRG